MNGNIYGTHRVADEVGVLPQSAYRLNPTLPLYDNEILIEVKQLNIDSASFNQMKKACHHDEQQLKKMMRELVRERGKHHNPVTGSGGMLIGVVKEIGVNFPKTSLKVGDRLATLVSLTLTPLVVDEIEEINLDTAQVKIKGYAILFATGLYAKLPSDLPDHLSLALLDVCGAPAQMERLIKKDSTVVIIGGGGKSGLLSLAVALNKATHGQVLAIENGKKGQERLKLFLPSESILAVDATKPLAVLDAVAERTDGQYADLVVNCSNVPHTEMATILATKEGGTAYFFNMATSFSAATLGAEGVGKDIQLIMGNGYCKGHWEYVFQLVREHALLRTFFLEEYGKVT